MRRNLFLHKLAYVVNMTYFGRKRTTSRSILYISKEKLITKPLGGEIFSFYTINTDRDYRDFCGFEITWV